MRISACVAVVWQSRSPRELLIWVLLSSVAARCPRAGALTARSQRAKAFGLGVLLVCDQAQNQGLQLITRQRRDLHQAGIERLQLCFAHCVWIDAMNTLVSARPLQPTEENLGGTGIRDGAFS